MAKRNQNPMNSEHSLFKRLTRLLSGPIVNYQQQQVRREKRTKMDKYASTFKSASGQPFKKKSYNPFEQNFGNLTSTQARQQRYIDFEQMEFYPILASAIDIYADEITTHSEFNKLIKIDCHNEEIKNILETLYYQVLNIEFNLFGWVRSLCKYGDFFLYLDIDEEMGVKSIIGIPPAEIERLEGEDPTNPNYIQYQWNSAGMTFENWQIAHFRILGNDKWTPFGTSVLDPARRIWRQLVLLEDAMIAYRVVRAPDRRVFYIDTLGIPAEEVEQYMQKAMTALKRHQVVDPDNGKMDLRYNPASIEEDFWIAVRGQQSGTKIETLQGTNWASAIDDVKYLKNNLFAAIKIPMSYLDRGEGASEDKVTLSQKDIEFARTIQRIQRSVTSELEKIGIIHLYTLGYKGSDLTSFKVMLNNPSKIAQLQDLEHLKTKLDIASSAKESMFSQHWIAKNIFGITEEEFVRNQRERFYDKKLESAMAKFAELAAGGETGMGGGFGLEGTPTPEGMEAPSVEELGADIEGEEPETTEEPEKEGVLLAAPPAAPAKRNEESFKIPTSDGTYTTTAKAKGKFYKPVHYDKRNMGARHKNMLSMSGISQGGKRQSFKGYHDMTSLGKGIVSENVDNYEVDNTEEDINNLNFEFKKLIEGLEKKDNESKV